MSGWSATLIAAGHILLPGSMSPVSLFEIWGLIQMISRSRSGWVTDISEPANVRPGCKVEGDAKADLSRAFNDGSRRRLIASRMCRCTKIIRPLDYQHGTLELCPSFDVTLARSRC